MASGHPNHCKPVIQECSGHHTNLVIAYLYHAVEKLGKLHLHSEQPLSQYQVFMWFFFSFPIVKNYLHDGEPSVSEDSHTQEMKRKGINLQKSP